MKIGVIGWNSRRGHRVRRRSTCGQGCRRSCRFRTCSIRSRRMSRSLTPATTTIQVCATHGLRRSMRRCRGASDQSQLIVTSNAGELTIQLVCTCTNQAPFVTVAGSAALICPLDRSQK
jgi:hypothetical protein